MPHRVPQSVAIRVPLKAYLATDHVTPATGKTIAVVVSKNGGAFGNPSVGATNAAEIANGWYYVDLSVTDTGTLGPVIVRGTSAAVDDVEIPYQVVDATNMGASNLDAAISSRSTYAGGAVASVTSPVTVGTNNDKAGYDLTAGYDPAKTAAQAGDAMALTAGERTTLVADVWAAAGRTLTSFGTLVADAATAVWGAATRDLTDKADFSLTSAYDPAKTASQPGDAMTLNAAYDAAKTAGDATIANQTTIDGHVLDVKAKTDLLPASPAATGDIPTTAQVADKILARSLAGGADGGRTVQDALRVSRNKVAIVGTAITVYAEDDTTIAWTGTLTTNAAAQPITAVDPA